MEIKPTNLVLLMAMARLSHLNRPAASESPLIRMEFMAQKTLSEKGLTLQLSKAMMLARRELPLITAIYMVRLIKKIIIVLQILNQ